jgi:toxin-antitoxin system PIN domain toxin
MRLLDVNVLVYAHRADELVHVFYRDWLTDLVDGDQPFALSVLALAGFVRVVTSPRIYAAPTPLPLALAAIDNLAGRSRCHVLAPGPRHWELFSQLCRTGAVNGKHVHDAQHAAVAVEHGCTWVTRDGDFGRFATAGLRWERLEPPPA